MFIGILCNCIFYHVLSDFVSLKFTKYCDIIPTFYDNLIRNFEMSKISTYQKQYEGLCGDCSLPPNSVSFCPFLCLQLS